MNLSPEDPGKRLEKSDKFFKVLVSLAAITTLVTLSIVLFMIFDTQARYQAGVRGITEARNQQLNQIENGTKRTENLVYCIVANPVAKEDNADTRIAKIKACAEHSNK